MGILKPLCGAAFAFSLLGLGACSSGSSNFGSSSSSSSSSSSGSTSSGGIVAELSFPNLYYLADFPIGVAVSAGNETQSIMNQDELGLEQRNVIEQHFSELTAGNIMKMSYLQPNQNDFTWTHANALVDYASANGMGIHGHTLVWHSDYQVPNWMKTFEGDKDAWLELIDDHVTAVVTHFAGYNPGVVTSWDVVNEAFVDSGYRQDDSLFYQKMGADYIERAFRAAHDADPNATLYYNDFNIEGGQPKFDHILNMVDDFLERDVPIHGIGFQMHIHLNWPSISDIRAAFQEAVNRNLMVKITELDIPINNPHNPSHSDPDNYRPFTEEWALAQKRRYCEVVAAYMEVVDEHLRGGITVWGLYDGDTWLSAFFDEGFEGWPLLFNHDLKPKPAAQGVGDALMGIPCD